MSIELYKFTSPFIPQTKIESAKVNEQFGKIGDSMDTISEVLSRSPVFGAGVSFPSVANKGKVIGVGEDGAPAFRNVMTSLTDTATPDALMPRGAFGVGTAYKGIFPSIGADATPLQVALAIGGDGYYDLVSANGDFRDFGSFTPQRYGVIKGYAASSNMRRYSWQEYTGSDGNFRWMRRAISDTEWSGWALVFNQQTILGTVSQSAGVPTGAIIERGANSNGSYVIFADGTVFCWLLGVSYYGVETNDTAGKLAYSRDLYWDFPVAMITNTVVTNYAVGVLDGGAGPVCWPMSVVRLTGTAITGTRDGPFYITFSTVGGFRATVNCFAIGRKA